MSKRKKLAIKEFSYLTGIKTANLRFYDKIGLLRPETRGDNQYRYYSRHQLDTAYIIGTLRGLGVGIEEIREFTANTSPEKTLKLFSMHNERIENEIKKLEESKQVMKTYSQMIREALKHSIDEVFIEEKTAEKIFLCPPLPKDLSEDEGGIFSYEYAEQRGVNLGFPQGTVIEQSALENENVDIVERYYFKSENNANAEKPAGLYAVIYSSVDIWKPEEAYKKILDYIKKENLKICGDAYEEYPLGDTTIQDKDQHRLRIEILIKRKKTKI